MQFPFTVKIRVLDDMSCHALSCKCNIEDKKGPELPSSAVYLRDLEKVRGKYIV